VTPKLPILLSAIVYGVAPLNSQALTIAIDRAALCTFCSFNGSPEGYVALDVCWGADAPAHTVRAWDFEPYPGGDPHGTGASAYDYGASLRVVGNDRVRGAWWDFEPLTFGIDRSVFHLDFSALAIPNYAGWQVLPLTDGDPYGARFIYGPGGGFQPGTVPDAGNSFILLAAGLSPLLLLHRRRRA
jgi:hypothetical protein